MDVIRYHYSVNTEGFIYVVFNDENSDGPVVCVLSKWWIGKAVVGTIPTLSQFQRVPKMVYCN